MSAISISVPVTYSANLPYINITFTVNEENINKNIVVCLKNRLLEKVTEFVYSLQSTNKVELQNVPFGNYKLEITSQEGSVNSEYLVQGPGMSDVNGNTNNNNSHNIVLIKEGQSLSRFGFSGMSTSGSFLMTGSSF